MELFTLLLLGVCVSSTQFSGGKKFPLTFLYCSGLLFLVTSCISKNRSKRCALFFYTGVSCERPDIPHADRIEGKSPPYKYGQFVRYQCHKGYKMEGSDTLTCKEEGWNPPLPQCNGTNNEFFRIISIIIYSLCEQCSL